MLMPLDRIGRNHLVPISESVVADVTIRMPGEINANPLPASDWLNRAVPSTMAARAEGPEWGISLSGFGALDEIWLSQFTVEPSVPTSWAGFIPGDQGNGGYVNVTFHNMCDADV